MKREKKRSVGFYAGFILFVLVALVNIISYGIFDFLLF